MFREWTRRVYPFSVSSLTIEGKEEAGEEGKKKFRANSTFLFEPSSSTARARTAQFKIAPSRPLQCARIAQFKFAVSRLLQRARARDYPAPHWPGRESRTRVRVEREKKFRSVRSGDCVTAYTGSSGFSGEKYLLLGSKARTKYHEIVGSKAGAD